MFKRFITSKKDHDKKKKTVSFSDVLEVQDSKSLDDQVDVCGQHGEQADPAVQHGEQAYAAVQHDQLGVSVKHGLRPLFYSYQQPAFAEQKSEISPAQLPPLPERLQLMTWEEQLNEWSKNPPITVPIGSSYTPPPPSDGHRSLHSETTSQNLAAPNLSQLLQQLPRADETNERIEPESSSEVSEQESPKSPIEELDGLPPTSMHYHTENTGICSIRL